MLKNFTLLFVEDDRGVQEQMKIMLQDEVKEFYQAYDGEQGLRYYNEKKPDIILTDINMPVMGGLDMAETIKQADKNQPILMLSAFDERDILLNAINIGVDGFIVKPIDMGQLNSKLNRIAHTLQHKIETDKMRLKELEQKQKEELIGLYHLAHYDTLTGIPNRYLFNEKIDQTIAKTDREHTQFALFFIDLDDFKRINDTYGHKAGDYVLVHLAKRINEVIHKEDTLARIGGDEFALIVENTSNRTAIEKLAKKIIYEISKPIYCENRIVFISCSIGICRYPKDTTCKEELIHFADLAMYHVKSTGKSHFCFYEEC